jgi:hypothetical protein
MSRAKDWGGISQIKERNFDCWNCGTHVGTDLGYQHSSGVMKIYTCPYCFNPNYFWNSTQFPGTKVGEEVEHLPDQIAQIYDESRTAFSASAFTASALVARKILMNVAVDKGAGPNQSFQHYVDWLADNGYLPPGGKGWVDHIRRKGKEATHEIPQIDQADAEELIGFCEMLLKFVYEFPARISLKSAISEESPS